MNHSEIKDLITGYCAQLERSYSSKLGQSWYFKIEDRIFAILDDDAEPKLTIRCEPINAAELRAAYPWVLPGFHINEEHWITMYLHQLDWPLVRPWLEHSYELAERGIRMRRRIDQLQAS